MALKKIYLPVTLALFSVAICQAQTFPPGGFPPTAELPNPNSIASPLPPGGIPHGAGTPTASGDYGPLGIGKPRSFPILRHLSEQHATHKAQLRSSPLGKIAKDLRKMFSQVTGGLVPAAPTPNHVELAAPGPQGAAAQIQKDLLDAPKRLAAIQQLGTVDCHWYPEALTQLAVAVRTDRSECVRFEAAKILSNSCCCEPHVIQALRICVAGSDSDGNPSERSVRIRNQAAIALENCLASGVNPEVPPLQWTRPEYPDESIAPGISEDRPDDQNRQVALTTFTQEAEVGAGKLPATKSVEAMALAQETATARQVLRVFRATQAQQASALPATGSSSLSEIWKNSK